MTPREIVLEEGDGFDTVHTTARVINFIGMRRTNPMATPRVTRSSIVNVLGTGTFWLATAASIALALLTLIVLMAPGGQSQKTIVWLTLSWGWMGALYLAVQILPFYFGAMGIGWRDTINRVTSALPLAAAALSWFVRSSAWSSWEWNIFQTVLAFALIDLMIALVNFRR